MEEYGAQCEAPALVLQKLRWLQHMAQMMSREAGIYNLINNKQYVQAIPFYK